MGVGPEQMAEKSKYWLYFLDKMRVKRRCETSVGLSAVTRVGNIMFLKVAATIAATVFATASFAATETFDFTGSYWGTYYSSPTFHGDNGGSVEVTAGTYNNVISDGLHTAGDAYVGQWTGYGLGVWSSDGWWNYEEHYVDGSNPEFLKFDFGTDVTIESISFGDYGNGQFDWYASNGSGGLYVDMDADVSGTDVGSMFFLGAWGSMGFKVESITVSYDMSEVPLPAAGFLLLGGLGGLVALKRRKKA